MVYDNGEHRVIQRPEKFMTGAPKIIYIHKFDNKRRYICITYNTATTITWGTKGSSDIYSPSGQLLNISGDYQITSIGKTLIISDDAGVHYFLWSKEKQTTDNVETVVDVYKSIGDTLPVPDVEFKLEGIADNKVEVEGLFSNNWLVYSDDRGIYIRVNELYQKEWNDLIVGLHSRCKKDAHQKKWFWGTFAIRVALKMYDGTYAMISNPILMFNQFNTVCLASVVGSGQAVRIGIRGQQLMFKKNNQNLSDWKDLISEIVIFVSRESTLFDTSSNAICEYYDPQVTYGFGACISNNEKAPLLTPYTTSEPYYKVLGNIESEGIKELVENGIFYKLCSIGVEQSSDWESVDDRISTTTLDNITTQEQLPEDDYFGHNTYVPHFLYAYNSRLNMANVSRDIFKGFSYFLPYDNDSPNQYTIYVKIATDSGERVVKKVFTSLQKQGIWFYYPDNRATHVTIMKGSDCILDKELKEHPSLHGAYYFQGNLTTGNDEPSGATQTIFDRDVDETAEMLPNYVIQSEVNNPFVFKAAGYFKVGTGKILAMSSITQALSEGQFGQFPLLVFSESGVWALTVADTGYYSSIHPISREVSLDPACVIQTDGAVFFTSAKGLMVVVGSQVKCVSEQLSGKMSDPFVDYLKNAFIAYDYRDSLLWIFDGASSRCWVYSIKSGTFGRYDFGTSAYHIISAINDYPDYLLQDGTWTYSLMNRPDINKDQDNARLPYPATIKTRPMKLENALALKSIMQIKHIHDIENLNAGGTNDPTLTFKMEGSNNLKNWVELKSLRGTPWKYYRFEYDFTNLKATDRFSGTMLVTQERRTDKLR